MSEVLVDIAEPMVEGLTLPREEGAYRTGLMLAAAIWNASRLKNERERAKALAEVKETGATPMPEELRTLCESVYERARRYGSGHRKSILDVDVVCGANECRVNVVSAEV